MGRGGGGGMRQGQRGRDTGGRGCGGREQRDSKVTRVGAASWSGSGPRGGGGYEWVHLAGSVVTHGRVDWCVVARRTQPVETCHLERKLKYKA